MGEETFLTFLLKFFPACVENCLCMEDYRRMRTMGETNRTKSEMAEINARIEQHLPLVKHVVFQVAVHFPRHVDREELARAGALGLVEASRRYDDSRGVPFERFAAQRIRGSILDAVRAADWAPRSVRLLARRLEATEQQLATELGRVPNLSEMAQSLGVGVDELCKLQDRLFRSVVLALDHETSDDGDEELTLVDILQDRSSPEPLEELETRELHSYLRDAVHLLPERQRLVIVGYFLEGKTSQDLARFLGVTESRISQLRSEALRNLKLGIEAQYEKEDDEVATGRVAKRQAAYVGQVSEASQFSERLGRWDAEYDIPEEPLLPVGVVRH
ncbi:MAG: FliA/WhiG family RNA polymerase sigma factor [Acidimicrobiales bacterium]